MSATVWGGPAAGPSPPVGWARADAAATAGVAVIHEYGHFLWDLTGFDDAAWEGTSEPSEFRIRREELLNVCFQGAVSMRLAGFGRQQQREFYEGYRGDDSHGTTENIKLWIAVGYGATTMMDCNTYVSPQKYVS